MTSSFYDWPVDRQELALGQLAQKALRAYSGTFSPPKLVKYRENAIFSVVRDDGVRLALRIHRYGYHSNRALASELVWMQALSKDGIEVPGVVRARDGSALTFARIPAVPERRQIDLLEWLNGRSLGELETCGALGRDERRATYARIGALAARLHNHAAGWSPPETFTRHSWYADELLGETPFWGRFWELEGLTQSQISLLQDARTLALRDLSDYGLTPGNSGLIHADLLADNVLMRGTTVRPIDFDDCGFGWHMFELATILYFVSDHPDYVALRSSVFDGYRSVRSLSDRDEAALPLFLLVRATTYLGWVHSRSETATARELAPALIERCCDLCERYVVGRGILPAFSD